VLTTERLFYAGLRRAQTGREDVSGGGKHEPYLDIKRHMLTE
jgi:hypothetical protein